MTAKTASSKLFHTALFDSEVIEDIRFPGNGFCVLFRNTSTPGRRRNNFAPDGGVVVPSDNGGQRRLLGPPHEAMILAPDFEAAIRVAGILLAASAVIAGGITLLPEDVRPYQSGQRPPPGTEQTFLVTSGIALSAKLAAKASRRKSLTLAVCRLLASYRSVSVHHMDLQPSMGQPFRVDKDPLRWVSLAQAATTAFGVVEDLNVKVIAFAKKPPVVGGLWDPVARRSLEERLKRRGIDPSTNVAWLLRGPPTKLERAARKAAGHRLPWSRGVSVRDRSLNILDAIYYAQNVRNKAAAHGGSSLVRSLTATDVFNVQRLSRELIINSAGVGSLVSGGDSLPGTVGAALEGRGARGKSPS